MRKTQKGRKTHGVWLIIKEASPKPIVIAVVQTATSRSQQILQRDRGVSFHLWEFLPPSRPLSFSYM